MLSSLFGNSVSFTVGSESLAGVTRSFTSFEQAAEEAGISRIYGGIHFLYSDLDGLTAGDKVGNAVVAAFAGTDTQPPRISVDPFKSVGNHSPILSGHVTDTVSGVASFTAKIDNGAPINVNFDATTGAFNLPLNLVADGVHSVELLATDVAGNPTSPLDLTFNLDTAVPIFSITSPTQNGAITAGVHLTGIANPTGSTLTGLNYSFDGGTVMPIGFTSSSGAFDVPLDISALALGPHHLTMTATDPPAISPRPDLIFRFPPPCR